MMFRGLFVFLLTGLFNLAFANSERNESAATDTEKPSSTTVTGVGTITGYENDGEGLFAYLETKEGKFMVFGQKIPRRCKGLPKFMKDGSKVRYRGELDTARNVLYVCSESGFYLKKAK